MFSKKKVLVNAATGKFGYDACLALVKEGFDVFGTTRSATGGAEKLTAIGATPVVGDYTSADDFARFLDETGATKLLLITDFWTAAGKDEDKEFEHGKMMIDAAARSEKVDHVVFVSVADAEQFPKQCRHIHAKVKLEAYLKKSDLKCWSILGPVAFFENLDDPANYNPLTKGSLKFLMMEPLPWCSTYDIGRAAAVQFKNARKWKGKKMDVIGYVGSVDDAADALEKVGGFPVKRGLAMPIFVRKFLMSDLHYMCEFYAKRIGEGVRGTPEEFRKHVPDALDAEGWFRHHGKYANGEPIVGNTGPVVEGETACAVQ